MSRLSDAQLEELLNDVESHHSERKESFKGETSQRSREAVCAFANDISGDDTPGVLFIGAKDNGEGVGLEIGDELLRALANMKSDGQILPFPALTVEKRVLKGAEMAVVIVQPSDIPPVKYKGRIWIRTGSRRSLANEQEERILNEKRRYKNIPFDIRPIPSATINDLSKTIFENEYLPAAFAPDVLEGNQRSYEERLATCKMIVASDEPTPTLLGLLALGKSPQDHLPGAYVQFLRINGEKLVDEVIDEASIGGTIREQLRFTEQKLQSHNRRLFDVTSAATHQTTISYPLPALQQVLYNALLHRTYEGTNTPTFLYWYNDRIEVQSPGGPYGNVTSSNFGEAGMTDYRNPNIAELLKALGFVQRFGRGIAIAKEAMRSNGNPPLRYECEQSGVLYILPAKR